MIKEIEVKSVLNRKKQRDSWFLDEYTFNPFSSCSYNCLYCYIRGSKYGANLEKNLSVKVNALEILDRQLFNRAKKNEKGFVVISSSTDPYLPVEKEYEITRGALKLILKHRFPVHIITKSTLVERDFDLLHQIDKEAILPNDLKSSLGRGTLITFSFSTLDDKIGRIFESGAPSPTQRLETLRKTQEAGFLSGVSMMPLIPYITDTTESLHRMFSSFKEAQADYVMPATITLWGKGKADSKTLMMGAIRKHFLELIPKYEKFFSHSDQMPKYYQEAFYKKMKKLSKEYEIQDRICK